ncbi:MAG: phenylalanine--tRNA ligase subunit beta [Candidatus Nealsonbacteria bacterium]|nr:phenylalanine--tRNA ligase subunit beta [Candidatus Nealsonbacteria bacterium]
MLFSYNWIKSFFKDKIPSPKQMAEGLKMHAFEIDGVERKKGDYVIDIDILPNRGPDCFSHIGIAREVSAIFDLEFRKKEEEVKEGKDKAKKSLELKVNDKEDCHRYTARVVKGLKVGPTSKDIREKLEILGLQSINNVVDLANYVMLETGQPLHAFDLDKVADQKIIVRRAKKGERIDTLDDKAYQLDKNVLVIADPEGPLAIAGIKGGEKAEITRDTKNIAIESANFNPQLIRTASQRIGLRTDASWRFEHGLDLNLTESAVDMVASLISSVAGGAISGGRVDFYPQKPPKRRVKLNLEYVNSLLGVEISPKRIKEILEKLYFEIIEESKEELLVGVPSFRLDVSIPEDLVEEVGRIHGYENIKPKFPIASLVPPLTNFSVFWKKRVQDILKESGFNEVYTSSFVNQNDVDVFGYQEEELIETDNPISAEYQYLRPSLILKLVKVLGENQKFFKNIRIFEVGKTFKKPSSRERKEKTALTGVVSGDVFYEVKGVMDLLLNEMGISDIWYDEYQPTPEDSKIDVWECKRCAEIKVGDDEIGFLGEINSQVLDSLGVEGRAVVFDFDFEMLEEEASEEHEYNPISSYPEAVRDVAVLVPNDIFVEDVLNRISEAGGELVRDVDLFDIYEGEELPEGKKNLAFHIIYQAEDRTLSSQEIDKLQNKIIKVLEEEPDWEVRK